MKLQLPGNQWIQRNEIERNRALEQADAENHKKLRDLEVGPARFILTSDGGIRYEVEIGEAGVLKVLNMEGREVPGLNQSQFSENVTVQRTPLIELNSAYGLSAIRDIQTVTGSGAISASTTGEILLSTGATATSTARLDSAERLRYLPGYGAEIGVGIRIPTAPTGNQELKWGMRNPGATEGLYFGIDATGFYVATLRGGTETKVRQTAFNVDKLDGTGPSGLALDLTAGNIFQVEFTWYGYGQIKFEIVKVVDDVQQHITMHQITPSGATSVQSPNLPIFALADNGGDAADIDMYVGGRQGSVVGAYAPKFRTTGQERTGVTTSTTSVPLVSFRNKTGFEDRSIRLDAATVESATNDHIFEVYINPTLTGASWVNPTNKTAAETAVETDVSATALSGGTLIHSFYGEAGGGSKTEQTSAIIDFDVPENQIITLAARTVTGGGTATSFFSIKEEW